MDLKLKMNLGRYGFLFSYIIFFCVFSLLIRFCFFFLSFDKLDLNFFNFLRIFTYGYLFDLGAALFMSLVYAIFLLIFPKFLIGSLLDKIISYFILFILLFIAVFGFLAEFPFWAEFNTRFNFIAVDYLIYTFEVVENIKQSYPLPLIFGTVFSIIFSFFYIAYKLRLSSGTFQSKVNFINRLKVLAPVLIIASFYIYFIENKQADWSQNIYNNELSKNGVYSFFAAFRSNELDYETFYDTIQVEKAFTEIKQEIKQENQTYIGTEFWDLKRDVKQDSAETHPDIVLICLESFSADFMGSFGNSKNITPYLDKLVSESIFFSNLYATGTRTVRGMEALTLCVPPTPGNSIVRRPDNQNLFSINTVLQKKNYESYFVYGGDGYFDNMNNFFGGQGFNIIDRNRGNPLTDKIKTSRQNIPDEEVQFENAWGVSDEDIYNRLLKEQDKNYKKHQKAFYFVMTTSNHKPYTFPKDKIDLPQGSRDAAVKYTDYAIAKYLEEAKTKAWFKNTVFLIVADHCASSAGKWDINISKYLIPAWIYNSGKQAEKITRLVSQIDLIPTLFGILNWNYQSEFYGKDIYKMKETENRALLGNYRTLGYLSPSNFLILNDRKKSYEWNYKDNPENLEEISPVNSLNRLKIISYYQTASYRYKYGKMKQ